MIVLWSFAFNAHFYLFFMYRRHDSKTPLSPGVISPTNNNKMLIFFILYLFICGFKNNISFMLYDLWAT